MPSFLQRSAVAADLARTAATAWAYSVAGEGGEAFGMAGIGPETVAQIPCRRNHPGGRAVFLPALLRHLLATPSGPGGG